MNPMTLNYVLLAITGVWSIIVIVNLLRGRGFSNRPIRDILAIVLFVLVLIATIQGMDYTSFRMWIERRG